MPPWLRKWIRTRALGHALKRAAPDRIPLNWPNSASRNYATVYLCEGGARVFYVDAMQGEGLVLTCLNHEDGTGIKVCLPNRMVEAFDVEIVYYLGDSESRSSSYGDYLLSRLFLSQRFFVAKDYLISRIFIFKRLVSRDRYVVLRCLLDEDAKSLGSNSFRFSVVSTVFLVHGNRVYKHPDYSLITKIYAGVLGVLTGEGLLEQDSGIYKIRPEAYERCRDIERDNLIRSRDRRMGGVLIFATFAMAVAAGIQAYAVWPKNDNSITSTGSCLTLPRLDVYDEIIQIFSQ